MAYRTGAEYSMGTSPNFSGGVGGRRTAFSVPRNGMGGSGSYSESNQRVTAGDNMANWAELNPQAEANRAAMDVQNKGDRQMESENRRLRSMGIDPGSGTAQAINKNARIALAAAKSGAANRGRRATEKENFNRNMQVAKLLQGDRSQDMQEESMSWREGMENRRMGLAEAQFAEGNARYRGGLEAQLASDRAAQRDAQGANPVRSTLDMGGGNGYSSYDQQTSGFRASTADKRNTRKYSIYGTKRPGYKQPSTKKGSTSGVNMSTAQKANAEFNRMFG